MDGGSRVAEVLKAQGVEFLFTLCGGHISPILVEAKRRGPGKWEALTDNGREQTGLDVLDWVVEAEGLGAGEILVTSVDMEGTRKGFDVGLIARVRERVRIPVIACGGAGSAEHVSRLLEGSGCDAVCCASIFHYGLCGISDLKRELSQAGYAVRL